MLALVSSFDGQIVQENKTQTNFRPGKSRRQMIKWIRGANRGNRRAIQRLFAGAKQLLRILEILPEVSTMGAYNAVWVATPATDDDQETYPAAPVAEAQGRTRI